MSYLLGTERVYFCVFFSWMIEFMPLYVWISGKLIFVCRGICLLRLFLTIIKGVCGTSDLDEPAVFI